MGLDSGSNHILPPGVYYDISHDDYRAIPYFSKSKVAPLLRSPKYLQWHLANPNLPTPDMIFCSLVDAMLLEPELVGTAFWVRPDTYTNSKGKEAAWSLQSKTCRAEVAAAQAKGLQPISNADLTRATTVCNEIRDHHTAGAWLDGKHQATIIWKDPETGIMCKGRPDILRPGEREVDLKLTEDARPTAFSRIATRLLYHVQGAMYTNGLHCAEHGEYPDTFQTPFSFIVAEAHPPHDVVAMDMEIDALDVGWLIFQEAIRRYAECVASGRWPGHSDYAEPLTIKRYAINQIQFEGDFNV